MYKIVGADQKEYGPISAEMLRQWISEGRVNGQTRVQAEGTNEWKPLAQLPEFGLAASMVPPPALTPPVAAETSNPLAMWAFGLSLFSLFCCQFLGGIVSIVLGAMALSRIKNNPALPGHGFALAGLIIGVISAILGVILGVVIFSEAFKNGFPR